MKIVFLDIDGVLNSEAHLEVNPPDKTLRMSDDEWWAEMLDPSAIERLNYLLERTEAVVVVSSSWRWARDNEQLLRVLRSKGFTGKIVDSTPQKNEKNRGREIKNWLDSYDGVLESYAILDDDGDMEPLRRRHVLTDPQVGLQDADVKKAIKLLRRLV